MKVEVKIKDWTLTSLTKEDYQTLIEMTPEQNKPKITVKERLRYAYCNYIGPSFSVITNKELKKLFPEKRNKYLRGIYSILGRLAKLVTASDS